MQALGLPKNGSAGGEGRRGAGGVPAGCCVARASGCILPHAVMALGTVGAVPDITRSRWAATWWLRGLAPGCVGAAFRSLSGVGPGSPSPRCSDRWASSQGPPGVQLIVMNPSTSGTLSAGARHGSRGGLAAPRGAWACAAVGISQKVPETGGPDAPMPSGMGNARDLSLLACALGRTGQAPRAWIPVWRCGLVRRGSGQSAAVVGLEEKWLPSLAPCTFPWHRSG